MNAVGSVAGSRLSSESECERRRGRPMSGGLWSVLSWLRGDERSSSSDSLSSAGSARTAASFAFLAPPPPQSSRTNALPLFQPPTDSYRRRLQDSHFRRQQDRDLTLHRKYGLYYGYDAFSLPHGRKNLSDSENRDRDRRAASESFPRRTAYVPGKRRAPLPPARARPHSIASEAPLTRRHSRKRPAPQPPTTVTAKENREDETNKEKQLVNRIEMNDDSERDCRLLADVKKETNSEKSSTKFQNSKEPKLRSEKSFLRQIFENKKRNSPIDPADRILPNISELDRRAAEIIESCKLKPLEQNNNAANINTSRGEAWFCTRCLRKYDSTVVTCQNCLPEQKRLSGFGFKGENSTQTEKKEPFNGPSTSRVSGVGSNDKQKLKEMLKEMKDSLPKRPKHESGKGSPKMIYKFDSTGRNSSSFETETLRVGGMASKENNDVNPIPSTSKSNVTDITKTEQILPKIKSVPVMQNVIITQQVVLVGSQSEENPKVKSQSTSGCKEESQNYVSSSNKLKNEAREENVGECAGPTDIRINNLHTPLKISSLLNPVYVPKVNVTENLARRNFFLTKSEAQSASTSNSTQPMSITINNSLSSNTSVTPASITNITPSPAAENLRTQISKLPEKHVQENSTKESLLNPTVPNNKNNETTTDTKIKQINSNNTAILNVNQHSRRRALINQLEQSIAKGDEKAAAEAAAKLAQLKLSCSVLSFTSQIMAGASGATKNYTGNSAQLNKTAETKLNSPSQQPNKVNVSVQSIATAAPNKPARSKDLNAVITNNGINSKTSSPNTSNHKSNEVTGPSSKKPLTSTEPSTSKQITSDDKNSGSETVIQVWVEDREATRGPLRLHIPRRAVMGDLRRQAETSLGLPGALQRWIVGRALCTDDGVRLDTLAGPDLSAPFYLCVVEAEHGGANIKMQTTNVIKDKPGNSHASDVYSELVQLEQKAIVLNTEAFECGVCMEECALGRGAILRECIHTFCRDCLSDLVRYSEEPVVSCPAMGCPGVLQEREIRALVSLEEYERWLARGLAAAETGTRNAFHCRTRDCTGWAFCDPEVQKFPCPVCKHTNCIPCQAIHEGETCEQHLRRIEEATSAADSTEQTDEGTRALLDTLIRKGEALECPECSAVITKKWGCDWIKCSACKTEICWVTRGRRWGPGGKGDTSGGCRCGVDGVRCHPSCAYCH